MKIKLTKYEETKHSSLQILGKVLAIFIVSTIISILMLNFVNADILVDNLDPNNATKHNIYGTSTISRGLYGETAGGVAFLVPAASDYYLDSISVIAQYYSGTSKSFQLAIYSTVYNSSESYYEPVTLLTSKTIITDSTSYKTYTADFNKSFVLQKGVVYAAVAQALDPGNDITLYLKKGKTGAEALSTQWLSMYGNMGQKDLQGNPLPPYWMQMWNPGILVTGSAVPVESSLTGKINLENFSGDITSVPVTVELNDTPYTVNLDSGGNFSILDIPAETYDVRIKASHWLAKKISGVVINGSIDLHTIILTNGDINGDNGLDESDLAILSNDWYLAITEASNPNSDLNGDGGIDESDLAILSGSWYLGGD